MSINRRFLEQLPFTIQVLGRTVHLGKTPENRITIELVDCDDCSRMDKAYDDWQIRKWIIVSSPDENSNYRRMRERLLVTDAMKDFVRFFVAQPIGPRALIFDTKEQFTEFDARAYALDEAALTWDAITNWERKANGKLAFPVPCAGYRSRPDYKLTSDEGCCSLDVQSYLCTANVIYPSCLCGPHKKQGAKTLFNYYPFFINEGFPELV